MHSLRGPALILVACVGLLGLVVAPAPARAEAPAGVLVLGVSQDGKADGHLTRALQDHLYRNGEKVVKATDLSSVERRCAEAECLARVAERTGAAIVLGVRAQATSPRSVNVTAWLYDAGSKLPLERQEHCSSCAGAQVEVRIKEVADKLLVEQRARALMNTPPPATPDPTTPAPSGDQPDLPVVPDQPGTGDKPAGAGDKPAGAADKPAGTADKPASTERAPDLSSLPEDPSENDKPVARPPINLGINRGLPTWRKVTGGIMAGLTVGALIGGITGAVMDGSPSAGPCDYNGASGQYRCVWDTKSGYIASFVLAGVFGVGTGLLLGLPVGGQGDKP